MVLMCLALSVFSTMPEFEEQATLILYYIVNFLCEIPNGQFQEIIFVFWLAIEYVCRIWSAGCRSRYRGWPMFYDGPQEIFVSSPTHSRHCWPNSVCHIRLLHHRYENPFLQEFLNLDIIVITASLVVLCMGATGQVLISLFAFRTIGIGIIVKQCQW